MCIWKTSKPQIQEPSNFCFFPIPENCYPQITVFSQYICFQFISTPYQGYDNEIGCCLLKTKEAFIRWL